MDYIFQLFIGFRFSGNAYSTNVLKASLFRYNENPQGVQGHINSFNMLTLYGKRVSFRLKENRVSITNFYISVW